MRTLHSHNVPYYEIASNEDGSTKHVREARQVAGSSCPCPLRVQTEFCPHSPECGQPQQPQFHYSTVDVLVVDGEPTHRWSTPSPFGNTRTEAALDQFYSGDRWGRAVRFYKERKSVTFSLGFHMNRTQDCEPQLRNTVNIGICCSWRPPNNYDLDQKQCRFTVTANLIPEYVYDGFDLRTRSRRRAISAAMTSRQRTCRTSTASRSGGCGKPLFQAHPGRVRRPQHLGRADRAQPDVV